MVSEPLPLDNLLSLPSLVQLGMKLHPAPEDVGGYATAECLVTDAHPDE